MVNFVAAYGWAVSESQAKVISPSAVPPLVPPPQLMIISGRSIIRDCSEKTQKHMKNKEKLYIF
jgi:hypothetical protein